MVATLKTTIIQEPSSASTNIQLDASGNTYLVPVSGQVGIGTTAPTRLLTLSGSGTSTRVQINNTVSGKNFGLYAADTGDSTINYGTASALLFTQSGSETMRIDSSGNVGIGTTSPGNRLHISGATNGASGVSIQSTGASGRKYTIYSSSAGGLYFANDTGGGDQMVLDASGNLLVGTTTRNYTASNGFVIETDLGYTRTDICHPSGTPPGNSYSIFSYAGGIIGNITQNGTTGVLYNVTSDQRLKTNVIDAPSASSIIDAIQIRSFDWKSDGSHYRYGVIAQELNQLVPEAVHTPADDTEMMGVDYSKLVPLLVKEIQELRARIATLEAK